MTVEDDKATVQVIEDGYEGLRKYLDWIHANFPKSHNEILPVFAAGAGEDRRHADALALDRRDHRHGYVEHCQPAVVEAEHESLAVLSGAAGLSFSTRLGAKLEN
jgi:hypothetical protein